MINFISNIPYILTRLTKMCKFNPSNNKTRIDPCMRKFIQNLIHVTKEQLKPVACCCGHGKYPITVLVKDHYGNVWDMFSNKIIKRKKKFYKKDKQGYYYVLETVKFKLGVGNYCERL